MNEPLLGSLFESAVAAAQPKNAVPPFLPPPPKGKTVLVGLGKAAASMARAVEENWKGPLHGLVVTRYGHARPCRTIEVLEASHPVPDAAGVAAAARILDAVQGLGEDDLVLCVISGGGSALLTLPAPGLTLADKQAVNTALLRCGANITEMNCVRKHLSAVKGGRLAAAAYPAKVVALAISDVPGDDLSVIASGPTVPDPTTFADARRVIEKYGIIPPQSVIAHLDRAEQETPKPGDPRLAGVRTELVTRPADALEAAAGTARKAGFDAVILGDAIEGEAREVAREQAEEVRKGFSRPTVLLSGGEVTVTIRGQGRGGPNAEYLLALAIALDGRPAVWAIACDTDGIDGSEDNAGAIIGPDTLERAKAKGLDPQAMLDDNNAYGFFQELGDLVISGPTMTNVNDFRAIVIEGGA